MIDISQWCGFDLETAGADELFRRGPSFTRLAGYTDPITGEVRITTDVEIEVVPVVTGVAETEAHVLEAMRDGN